MEPNSDRIDINLKPKKFQRILNLVEMAGVEPVSKQESLMRTTVYLVLCFGRKKTPAKFILPIRLNDRMPLSG